MSENKNTPNSEQTNEKEISGGKIFLIFFVCMLIAMLAIGLAFIIPNCIADLNQRESEPTNYSSESTSSFPENNSQESIGTLTTRNANNSDLTIALYKESMFEREYSVVPNADIRQLVITVQYFNEDDEYLASKTIQLGNVVEGNQYFYTLTPFYDLPSFTDAFDTLKIRYGVSGGVISIFG